MHSAVVRRVRSPVNVFSASCLDAALVAGVRAVLELKRGRAFVDGNPSCVLGGPKSVDPTSTHAGCSGCQRLGLLGGLPGCRANAPVISNDSAPQCLVADLAGGALMLIAPLLVASLSVLATGCPPNGAQASLLAEARRGGAGLEPRRCEGKGRL